MAIYKQEDIWGQLLCCDADRAARLASIFKSLSHPIRLRIVALLCQGRENVSALSNRLSAPQAIISQQLRILRMANLVSFRRENGFAVYELAEPNLVELVRCMEECC